MYLEGEPENVHIEHGNTGYRRCCSPGGGRERDGLDYVATRSQV